MPPRRLLPVLLEMTAKEFLRDRAAVFFTFLFPLVFVVAFGVTNQSSLPTLRVGVLDVQRDDDSAALVAAVDEQPGVEIRRLPPTVRVSAESVRASARAQKLPAAILIPARSVGPQGGPAIVVVGSRREAAAVAGALRVVQAALAARRAGIAPPFTFELARTSDEPLNDFSFTLPGLLAMALLQLGLFATATPLITARQRGSLRHLAVTPLPAIKLLQAQVMVRFVIAILQLGVMLGVATAFFNLQIAGNAGLLMLIVVLGAVMFIAIGYMLAGVVPGGDAGVGVVLTVNFAFLIFGQVFFDLSDSGFLSFATRAVPLSYLSDALRQVIVNGPPAAPMFVDCLALLGWTSVAVAVALRTFRLDASPREGFRSRTPRGAADGGRPTTSSDVVSGADGTGDPRAARSGRGAAGGGGRTVG